MTPLESFILEHADDDVNRLLLSRDRWPEIDMDLAVNTIEGRRRIRTRLPLWYSRTSLIYPTRLCTEQCSSAETASYKARVAFSRIFGGRPFKTADLTGGLGVDTAAFAGICGGKVFYNEANPALARAAAHNFRELGVDAIVSKSEVRPGSIYGILDGFTPDLIFLDPARRSSDGRKVFLLEDCSPDILSIETELFTLCRHIMVKLSPMADISMICRRLGHVREVHVVATGGECRELLLWMDRDYDGPPYVICYEGGAVLEAEDEGPATFCKGPEDIRGWLFEPGKSLLKAGLFDALSSRFSLLKASRDSHLYFSPEEFPAEASRFGKVFRILEALPLNKVSLKGLHKKYPMAEVSARGIPMDSDTLRKRLGVKPSAEYHVFGLHAAGENRLVVATNRKNEY